MRLGAGLTYTELMEEPLASLLPALVEASRTVGSPQIRNRGTLGGNLGTASPAGDSLPPLLVEEAEVELRPTGRRVPVREFLPRPQAKRAATGGADRGRPRPSVGRAADVHEGRAEERDGDRGLLARGARRSRERRDPRVVRLCRAGSGTRSGAPGGRGRVRRASRPGCQPDRRRSRHRGVPSPCPGCTRAPASTGAWLHEDRARRQRRPSRGGCVARREPALRTA